MPKKEHNFADAKEMRLCSLLAKCPHCHKELQVKYHKSRNIITLGGKFAITSVVKACFNKQCGLYNKSILPEEETILTLKGHLFGIDIISFIGQSYFYKHLNTTEIHNILVSDFNIEISKSEVCLLVKVFLELSKLCIINDMETILKLRQQGGIILSIDGIQPVKGHKVTYIFRDTISGRVLLAKSLEDNSSEELGKFIEQIKGAGIPILAVISDKQHSLVNAIETHLPGAIHQLCQYHYIKDAFKPVFEEDSKLSTDLKQKIRGIKKIEKRVKKDKSIAEQDKTVIQDFCQAIREILNFHGNYPYNPLGIKIYEHLLMVKDSIERCMKKKFLGYLDELLYILQPLSEFSNKYKMLKASWEWLISITKLLDGNGDKYCSYNSLLQYLQKIEREYISCPQQQLWLENIQKVATSFGIKLFSFLDKPTVINPNLLPTNFEIPRTNNALEIFIGVVKKAGRRLTGRRNIHQFLLEHADKVAMLYSLPSNINWQEKLSHQLAILEPAVIKHAIKSIVRNPERSKRRLIRKDLFRFLQQLEQKYMSL